MQLFAIIAKQDDGVEEIEKTFVRNFLESRLSDDKVSEYYALFEEHAGIAGGDKEAAGEARLTSVIDSVRILSICRKINKTLTQSQKVVVLVRLYELVQADSRYTKQRMAIITTVADVFRISKEESSGIEAFVVNEDPGKINDPNILLICEEEVGGKSSHYLQSEKLDACIFVLHVPSVDLYFLKYPGNESLYLNGLAISSRRIYLFANGSTLKPPTGRSLYYSDIVSTFREEGMSTGITFDVNHVHYRFPNGNQGLHDVTFSESRGGLIGIMGASGAGKTTLLNILSGISSPTSGNVRINGLDLHKETGQLGGIIGLIPQDDLLIEELTVYQNLYYCARLCFRDKTKDEINGLVDAALASLGLQEIRDYRVGSVLNKRISGGQRKRLNIALELIREPAILFVDEPTSGLSSRDSENVMDLLRELSLKGKLVFVVIHQPSSDIYKMFDRIILLDTGGYQIYYGNPVEAVMYFKKLDAQINSDIGECPVCGNVNPELLFNIIDAKVVDEFGKYTTQRKVGPAKWEEYFNEEHPPEKAPEARRTPESNLRIPGWFRQAAIFTTRDFLSKISNRQYLLLTLLEAPVLGFILSFIIRYIADPTSHTYIFRENENIPVYIFMSLIVSLFLGMVVSAEEIFKDSKILKREAFLNLSRSGYLVSKMAVLFFIYAIQALLFIVIGNSILEIRGMYFIYWLAFFSTAVCAGMIGLNISASLNSAITIYIVIPLLIIPMMVLSGAMFPFDKLNRRISNVAKVPWIAEVMVTKWSYEALMVYQFKNNQYEKPFYRLRQQESEADFKQVYLIPELRKRLDAVGEELSTKGRISNSLNELKTLKNEISKETVLVPEIPFEPDRRLDPDDLDRDDIMAADHYLDSLDAHYRRQFNLANTKKEMRIRYLADRDPGLYGSVKDAYYNESLAERVRKVYEKHRIVEFNNELIQQTDPIYKDPFPRKGLHLRSHFFAPRKYFAGRYIETYWFNMGVIWLLFLLFYIALYFNALKRLILFFEKLRYR